MSTLNCYAIAGEIEQIVGSHRNPRKQKNPRLLRSFLVALAQGHGKRQTMKEPQALITGKRFLVMGRAGLDLYADPPGTELELATQFHAMLGGSAANIAAGISRAGGAAALCTSVSNDAVGRHILRALKDFNINSQHVATVSGECRTSLAVVETRAENCQSVIYRNNAADFIVTLEQVKAIDLGHYDVMILTGTTLAAEPSRSAHLHVLEQARTQGIATVIDIDHRAYSWANIEDARNIYRHAAEHCDVVIGNDDEFSVMAGDDGLAYAEHLAHTTAKAVIYKMGAEGSITFTREERFETPIFPVKALKPTGAGDAFMANLMMSLANGNTLNDSVRRASAAAAIVVTRVGCSEAMPTPDDVSEFISTFKQA
jgi:5-dehydro-2-deoxygluconokinase